LRLKSVIAIAAATVAGVLVPTGAASAAGACSVVAPTKVTLDQSYEAVSFRLSSNCTSAGTEYASWDVYHPSEGWSDTLIFDGTSRDYWDLYDWEGPARYQVRPSMAFDRNYDDVRQNTAYVTVKLGSRLSATTARSNGRLTFSAYARTYSPRYSDWYKRVGAKVSLMYLAPRSSTWTWVKAATTNSTGKVTLSVVPKYGQYRLMVKETSSVWASYSATVRGK
jgi:hypothetical protein